MFSLKILVILIKIIIFTHLSECHYFDFVEHQLKPYQVQTFISKKLTISDIISDDRKVVHDYPNMIVSFTSPNFNQIFDYYDSFERKNLLHKSLIILYTNDLDEIELFIDFLEEVLPIWTRPRCLIVLFKDYVTTSIDTKMKNIFNYAWKHKFLDFSVISTNRDGNLQDTVYQFNPFFNKMEKKVKLRTNFEVFPDKLQDVQGYQKCVRFYSDYSTKIIYPKNQIKLFKTYQSRKIDSIFKVMNFSIKTINLDQDCSERTMQANFNTFTPGYEGFKDNLKSLPIPANEPSEKWVAVVPITPTSTRINVTLNIFYNMLIISCIIGSFIYVINFLLVTSENKFFNVVRLILGQSIQPEPKKLASRIIFLTIVTIFVLINVNDFYSKIIHIQFAQDEKTFESYEDLEVSNLPVITTGYLNAVYGLEGKNLSRIIKEIASITTADECVKYILKKTRNVICVVREWEATYIIEKTRKADESPIVKIASLILWEDGIYFYDLKNTATFAKKFEKILKRIHEAGLNRFLLISYQINNTLVVKENKKLLDNGINLQQLLVLLTCGFLLSVLIFILELIKSKFGKKSRVLVR